MDGWTDDGWVDGWMDGWMGGIGKVHGVVRDKHVFGLAA